MKCERCGGSVLMEPFDDANGSGNVALCISCGHRHETYTKLRYGAMTAAQFRAAAQPGRPKGARG